MRELLRAVVTAKPILALLEPEKRRGGLSMEEIGDQLAAADSQYERWGLQKEVIDCKCVRLEGAIASSLSDLVSADNRCGSD